MTEKEYLHLSEGDKCILIRNIITPNVNWLKDMVVEVVARSRFKEVVYFRNLNTGGVENISIKACLGMMKLQEKHDGSESTFKHKFKVGDTVWQMHNNVPTSYTIQRIEYWEDKEDSDWQYVCTGADGYLNLDDNCKIYGSKDALLDSLR